MRFLHVLERLDEGALLVDLGALDGRRILDSPMRGHRLPGQSGHASPAALSQTVNTKSISGAPGAANSSQFFERNAVDG
jgi:hypothetical protein